MLTASKEAVLLGHDKPQTYYYIRIKRIAFREIIGCGGLTEGSSWRNVTDQSGLRTTTMHSTQRI